MFLKNKYTIWYHQIIANAQSRINDGYVEKHHIIPKCLGGTDDASNLVRLTAREHYICHLLLTKMTEGLIRRKMLFAHWRMVHGNQNQSRYQLTNRQYESAKIAMGRAASMQNKGVKHSEEVIAKLRSKVPWNKGKTGTKSPEELKRLSERRRNCKWDDETKQKISEGLKHYNQTRTDKGLYKPRPRYRFILHNSITGEIIETTNLRKWCKDRGFYDSAIYNGKSDWKVIEKWSIKTGKLLI